MCQELSLELDAPPVLVEDHLEGLPLNPDYLSLGDPLQQCIQIEVSEGALQFLLQEVLADVLHPLLLPLSELEVALEETAQLEGPEAVLDEHGELVLSLLLLLLLGVGSQHHDGQFLESRSASGLRLRLELVVALPELAPCLADDLHSLL